MRRKVLYGILMMLLLSGCTKTDPSSPAVSGSQETIQDQADSTAESVAESQVSSEQVAEDSENKKVKNELLLEDLFIPKDECLKDASFMTANIMESILKYYPDLTPVKSEEGANGHCTYWKRDGIEYITTGCDSTDAAGTAIKYEDMDVFGLSIVSGCSFNCGLRPGMKESELKQYFPCMKKVDEVDNIYLNTIIRNDKMGPIQTTNFDYMYCYIRGASDEEVEKYRISGTIAYSVVAFIKDGEVCMLFLNLPTAG